MLVVLSLLACSGEGAGPEATPTPVPPPLTEADGPLPEPRMGVAEVVTPPEVLRPTEVQDRAAPGRLDVWFDPDATTFEALGTKLQAWGFSILDGDGESWRVGPPTGVEWPARLLPLPAVAKVAEAVDLLPLETGAFREGSERYGEYVHSWSWREGGAVQSLAGGPPPPEPVLPHALPAQVVRCLAPIRTDMKSGVSVGVGWERALIADPPAWALVLEEFGACRASGWLRLRSNATVTTLTVGGRPLAELDGPTVHALALTYLRQPRAYEDPSGLAAWDLLRDAPTETLVRALPDLAPGVFQDKLWEELDQRDHAVALQLATDSTSPTLRAAVAAEVDTLRAAVLVDPKAPADAVYAALTVWRPGPADPPGILERLRTHPAPRVRQRAWEITLDATSAACLQRAAGLGAADLTTASAIYRECPQQPVRMPAFQRVAALDRVVAAAMVRVVLEDPETLQAGVLAVRNAAAIERNDLLEATVRRTTVPRGMRLRALELLAAAGSPHVAELAEQHGAYLGYRPKNGTVGAGGGAAQAEP